MSILSQVLPAIRQVRAPLVGGYVWLLAAWLRSSSAVPDSPATDGNRYWRALARLFDELGSAGTVAAVSVVAYLVGALAAEGINYAMREFAELSIDEMEQAREIWEAKYAAEVPIRLLAEAELRFNVALPLVAVTLVLPASAVTVALILLTTALATHGLWLVRTAKLRWTIASRISRINTSAADGLEDEATDDVEPGSTPTLNDALDKLRELTPNARLTVEAVAPYATSRPLGYA